MGQYFTFLPLPPPEESVRLPKVVSLGLKGSVERRPGLLSLS